MTTESALASQIRNIELRYGRSMSDWAAILRAQGIEKPGQAITFLKSEHGLDHAAAHRIALAAREAASPTGVTPGGNAQDEFFNSLYTGARAELRPTHDLLMSYMASLGPFEMAPKKGYVSLRRVKQFAMIQPGAHWINVGLILSGMPVGGRLESASTFNALFTHRVRLPPGSVIDPELRSWISQAYQAAGER